MLTLSLLRHAKSSWDDPALEDFDRPLSKRGETAAPRMGAYMAAQGLRPDLVLARLSGSPTVTYEDGFYLAAPSVLLARIRKIEAKVHHALIVGHDPGIQGLALELSHTGKAAAMAALRAKFPTAALAVIRFQDGAWSKVATGKGRLDLFVTPKSLA